MVYIHTRKQNIHPNKIKSLFKKVFDLQQKDLGSDASFILYELHHAYKDNNIIKYAQHLAVTGSYNYLLCLWSPELVCIIYFS